MFSLLGKGRPLTGALLFRARKGGGECVGGWFGAGRDSLRRGGVKDCVRGGGLQRGEIAKGAGPAGPPAAGGRAGRPQAAPRLRPQAGAPCGPVLGRNLREGKGDGFADRGRGRRGGGGRRPPPAPACGRHFPPLARRPRCGTIGAEPKESEEQPYEKDSEL